MKEIKTDISAIDSYKDTFYKLLIDYAPKVIAAILLLIIGIWLIRIITKVTRKILVKRDIDATLIEFLTDFLVWGLRILLVITVLSKLGVESSSFVAIIGAAGLAVGLALQGSLSNFAGGILIIIFKPFRVGDTIETQGSIGSVIDIEIFNTQLLTANNQVIFIPNGALSNGTIVNYSRMETRRTDLNISLSYDADLKKSKEILRQVIDSNPKILKEPETAIIVKQLTEVGIVIGVRAWTKNADFFEVSSYILENCKLEFEKNNIAIKPSSIPNLNP